MSKSKQEGIVTIVPRKGSTSPDGSRVFVNGEEIFVSRVEVAGEANGFWTVQLTALAEFGDAPDSMR